MKYKNKVAVVGSLNYDVCLKQKYLPKEGETCFADSVTYCSGGKGANQAVQAAKLGLPTFMLGCVGNDYMGDFLIENLNKYSVDTGFIRRVEVSTGMSVAQSLYDGGVRAGVVRGANDCVNKADIDKLSEILIAGDIVIFQLEIPIDVIEYAMEVCRKKSCRIIFNAAPALSITEGMIAGADVFVVNEVEAEFYAKKTLGSYEDVRKEIEEFTKKFGNICIFTLGKEGAFIADKQEVRYIPAQKVDAVESTGAGDSFVGGLCYKLIQGEDIFTAAEFATLCSAKTVQGIGAQESMPFLNEIE